MNIEKSYDCGKFNFEQIADMNDLIEKITEDEYLSEILFTVTIKYCNKEREYTPSCSENKFIFGSRMMNDSSKNIKINIRIFDDAVIISGEQIGYIRPLSANTKEMSDEQKIITALDKWASYNSGDAIFC